MPSAVGRTEEQPADTCVDLGAPFSATGSAFYFQDRKAHGISRSDVFVRLKPSSRSFIFGKAVFALLVIVPEFFAANDVGIDTIYRDVIDSETIPFLLDLATLREMEAIIDVTK